MILDVIVCLSAYDTSNWAGTFRADNLETLLEELNRG